MARKFDAGVDREILERMYKELLTGRKKSDKCTYPDS